MSFSHSPILPFFHSSILPFLVLVFKLAWIHIFLRHLCSIFRSSTLPLQPSILLFITLSTTHVHFTWMCTKPFYRLLQCI